MSKACDPMVFMIVQFYEGCTRSLSPPSISFSDKYCWTVFVHMCKSNGDIYMLLMFCVGNWQRKKVCLKIILSMQETCLLFKYCS